MKDQRRDSYQPRERGDHSKRWIRIGEGSMEGGGGVLAARSRKASVDVWGEPSGGREAVSGEDRMVRIVWRGRSGSQESSQAGEGVKPVVGVWMTGARDASDVELFWREKEGWPAGILPRAFSDMPRSWRGTAAASMEEEREGVPESVGPEVEDWEGVGARVASSSESSESPMVKGPSASGMCVRVGVRAVGLKVLSVGVAAVGLSGLWPAERISLRRWLMRSISAWPLSSVKARRASNRFWARSTAYTVFAFSVMVQYMWLRRDRGKMYCCIDAQEWN
jgi:hypothetical protein